MMSPLFMPPLLLSFILFRLMQSIYCVFDRIECINFVDNFFFLLKHILLLLSLFNKYFLFNILIKFILIFWKHRVIDLFLIESMECFLRAYALAFHIWIVFSVAAVYLTKKKMSSFYSLSFHLFDLCFAFVWTATGYCTVQKGYVFGFCLGHVHNQYASVYGRQQTIILLKNENSRPLNMLHTKHFILFYSKYLYKIFPLRWKQTAEKIRQK